MSALLFSIAALFMAAQAESSDLDDGFYLITADTTAPSVTTAGGWTVHVGEPTTVSLVQATLRSQDNWNQRFQLDLEVPQAPTGTEEPPQWRVLVVNGTAHRQLSAGSGTAPGRSTMGFTVFTRADANAVAGYFQVQPRLRRHPGHQIAVRFEPPTDPARPGEAIAVTLQIENVGSRPIIFQQGGRNRAERDNQYDFIARRLGRALPDIGTSMHFGGLSHNVTLEPGEVFADSVDLAKWFTFNEAGVHDVLGTYVMALKGPADFVFTVWEETVAAPFTLEVSDD